MLAYVDKKEEEEEIKINGRKSQMQLIANQFAPMYHYLYIVKCEWVFDYTLVWLYSNC